MPLTIFAQNGNVDLATPSPTAAPQQSSKEAAANVHPAATSEPGNKVPVTGQGSVYKPKINLDDPIGGNKQRLTLWPASVRQDDTRQPVGKVILGDYEGAIVDLNHLIAKSPRSSDPYRRRAVLKAEKGDAKGGLADCDLAIKFDRRNADAYDLRARLKQKQGDFAGALTDINGALRIVPESPRYYLRRSEVEAENDDNETALADAKRAAELDPLWNVAWEHCAVTNFVLSRWVDALAAERHYCQPSTPGLEYSHLRIWISRTELGEKKAADQELADYLDARLPNDNDWAAKIGNYLLGRGTEADLFAAAAAPDTNKDAGQHCEAWFYSGIKRLIAEDKAGASENFRQCVATGQRTFVESRFARAELRRLAP